MTIRILTTFSCGHMHLEEKSTHTDRHSVRHISPLVHESRATDCSDCEGMEDYNRYFENLDIAGSEPVEIHQSRRGRFREVVRRIKSSRRLARVISAVRLRQDRGGSGEGGDMVGGSEVGSEAGQDFGEELAEVGGEENVISGEDFRRVEEEIGRWWRERTAERLLRSE